MLSELQCEIISALSLPQKISLLQIESIAKKEQLVSTLKEDLLEAFLSVSNALYRAGHPIISDDDYDHIYLKALRERSPTHVFLNKVEPEADKHGKTVRLPERMLSTEKAYTLKEIQRWIKRMLKAANEINIEQTLAIKITPKLDGFAAFDDGERLYTRGDGKRGTDITRAFERGLQVGGNGLRNQGPGEIVIDKHYFALHLTEYFDNSRNFQAAILAEKKIDRHVQQAIDDKAALFFPFAQLPCFQGEITTLEDKLDDVSADIKKKVVFDVDGVVIEITHSELKKYLGATSHHHRWQIAYKLNTESAEVIVREVVAQTSRSGRVNPVAELEPTQLSGVVISRATAHHYGMVKESGIGQGALIKLVRSGLVIPKIEKVITPAIPQIPEKCPSCQALLFWDSDYLYCSNSNFCTAQIENSIAHFFKTIQNIDGFGKKTIQKLYQKEIRSVLAIYHLTQEQYEAMGFGKKTAQNLIKELQRSRMERLEDYRLLTAMGIFRMGLSNCEKILKHHRLGEIFQLTTTEIEKIEGFSTTLAEFVIKGLALIKEDFENLINLGFNIEKTALISELKETGEISVISGKTIIFTGKMLQHTRSEMQAQARKLGAKIGTAVNSKTDYLIIGEKAGVSKLKAAEDKKVAILTEQAYIDFLLNSAQS